MMTSRDEHDVLPVPRSLGEIDIAWLRTVLNGSEVDTSELRDVRVERIGEGFGLTGVVARLHLDYFRERPESLRTLVAKLPLASPETPSSFRQRQAPALDFTNPYVQRCAREVRFYKEVAPAGLAATVHCYFCGVDDANPAIVLLFEDLPDAEQGDVLAGCSPDAVAHVLDAIAPLHALWWSTKAPARPTFSWMTRWGGDYAARHERFQLRVGPFLERWAHTLSPEIIALVEAMAPCYGALLAALDRLPTTVIHADLHLDNVMFRPKAIERPVVILDWQSICWGPAAFDVAGFMYGSRWADDRRASEHEPLERYVSALAENGVPGLSAEKLRRDCDLASLRVLGGIVGWHATVDLESLAGRERDLVHAALGDGRLLSAMLDHDVASLLATL